ncbi:MAG TPA: glycosyltransferase [Cellulomonas sp.]
MSSDPHEAQQHAPTDGGRVLLGAGTYDLDAHPRFRVVLEGMRARGWAVEEIVEPLAFDTKQRVEALQHASQLPRLAVALARAWTRLIPRLRRRRRRSPRVDVVAVGHLGHFDVGLVRRLTRPAPVVLDYLVSGTGTAADRRVGGGPRLRALALLDRYALSRADVVVVDTQENLRALDEQFQPRAVVIPVGADGRWFEAGRRASQQSGLDGLSVVFFGLFTPLQGTAVIGAALRALAGSVRATIVGTGQDEPEVEALLAGVPNVSRIPWVRADDLPALVAGHDVCLGIFGTGAKAQLVVPNKVYQGAAAGCAVVTSDTAPQRRALGENAVYVPQGDAVALADALRALAADGARLRALRTATREHAERCFTPERVVAPLDERLRSLRGDGR